MRASIPAAEPTAHEKLETQNGDFAAARRVIDYAVDAIRLLGEGLNGDFSRAVDLILAVKGRVIVSGMGKSGHVARKIAATLASTGTPAQFVHPAEASHGDLGAVTRSDALLMLSNSGETQELSDLITFAKRFSIPVIGIAGRNDSALLRASDVALLLPGAREACPMGLAPTTSTTLMLVLGDALAVALMERRGFTPDQYRELHPGGSLGRSLIRVCDIMHGHEEMPIVAEDAAMSEVLAVMSEKRFGCVGVVDGAGRLVGIFTHGDLSRRLDRDLLDRRASDVMTATPKVVAPAQLAAQALAIMNEKKITVLFVVDEEDRLKKPIGILHMHDCLRAGLQ
ncbi:MAG TPA: KpsF/GutQ family sugar-phosphate isomerase [Rhizomicrobium sp.]